MSNQESDSARIQRQANELSNHENSQRNQNSSGCFPAGTRIEIPIGTMPIEALSVGYRVVGVSLDTGVKRACKILKVTSHPQNSIWEIALSENRKIRTTAIHSFYSDGKWRMAKSLEKGDFMLHLSERGVFEEVEIIESKLIPLCLPVFNLIVEEDFTFIADGALAHSFSRFRGLRKVYWTFRSKAASLRSRMKSNGALDPSPSDNEKNII